MYTVKSPAVYIVVYIMYAILHSLQFRVTVYALHVIIIIIHVCQCVCKQDLKIEGVRD